MERIAEVVINSHAAQLGKIFHYRVPESLTGNIKVGHVVSIPFGRSNRPVEGFVVGFTETSEFKELKEIGSVPDQEDSIKRELVDIAFWMAEGYMCSLSDCLKLMLPPAGASRQREKAGFVALQKGRDEIQELIDSKRIRGSRQIEVLNYLISNQAGMASEIVRKTGADYGTLRSLRQRGLIEIREDYIDKSPLKNKVIERTHPFHPNKMQKEAIDRISGYIRHEKQGEFLIHGVTGSGKTEVYLQLISEVLKVGRQAIVLVPEISLTPQMIQRFVGRFGDKVAVLHSRLSDGERKDQWYRIKEGKVDVVVGARSAVFAPFRRPGIIIIDEEHEHTYKSEKTPKYHARDIARKRCEIENCIFVSGSATPSVETYYSALEGRVNLLKMPERVNNYALPPVGIIDMRKELEDGNKSIFSRSLYNAISENIDNNNQTILFLNRRGYSSFVLCRTCGYVARCRNCNISLTYHLHGDRLVCHYCGYSRGNFKACPSCGSEHIRHFGIGTQKLEEEVKKQFPTATVLRMDMDTTSRKNSHEEILGRFRDENINILIGTQMIAKGHDFPNVTLVGVISADLMLNIEDFRSGERTFQLLTQVAGRAGRAEKAGKVIIQTYEVDNFSIQTARRQDYGEFYRQEIILRDELKYPPFCDIISIMVTGIVQAAVRQTAEGISRILGKELQIDGEEITVLDAVPAPISKIKNRYRWRIIIKCRISRELREKLSRLLREQSVRDQKACNISIDVNPLNML